jgi:acyl carrier protein
MTEHSESLDTRLQRAFRTGLALPTDTDCHNLEFAKTAAWDSIAHLQLIVALEAEFNIMIDTQDMLAMSSYEKARTIVQKYDSHLS